MERDPGLTPGGWRVQLVDDDPVMLRLLEAAFVEAGYVVTAVAETVAAATATIEPTLELLITDHDLPDGVGSEVAEAARAVAPDVVAILYSASAGRGPNGPFDARLEKGAGLQVLLAVSAELLDRKVQAEE